MFVCIGNRNRSPFAQFFFPKMMSERDPDLLDRVEVVSAGFVPQAFRDYQTQLHIGFPEPFFDRPMAEMTRTILRLKGITPPSHWRTKELTPEMIEKAALTITALPMQKRELLPLFPKAKEKIFSLREIAGWDKPLLLEDNIEPAKRDEPYWRYVEENPEYVTKILAETEDLLVRGYPWIIERLPLDQSAKPRDEGRTVEKSFQQ